MKMKICAIVLAILISLSFISALSIKNVESAPEEIMPGETADVSIEIENTLNEDVTNVNVKLILTNLPFAPYQTSAERFVDEIEEGEDKTFNFKIIALPEADSGIYTIPVEITYSESDEKQNGIISLIINSNAELNVFSEDSLLIRGKESIFSVKIVNSGLSDIKFAYLIVDNIVGVKFISEQEQYIGDIDSDDFDSIEYKAYVSQSAPNLIKIPVTLKYRDATNKEFEEKKDILVRVYSLKEAQELGFIQKPNYLIFLGIGSLALFYIGYRIRKKRKLKARK